VQRALDLKVHKRILGLGHLLSLSIGALVFCGFPPLAQAQQPPDVPATERGRPETTATPATFSQQSPGTVTGTVLDRAGTPISGARVKLSRENSLDQNVVSDDDGRFFFPGIAPGPFQLSILSDGFATQTCSGDLQSGQNLAVPAIVLAVASVSAEVRVSLTPTEEAEAEIKDQEKQRVLGVLPNFYVTYNPTAVPLKPKQKFELAWKATVDPVNFGVTAAAAGIEQAANSFGGYGQGAQGYAKRYGAAYADSVTNIFIGSALLPSLLKQDPRYFYKGTGSVRSRVLYALANSVICKGDNGHWQPNYSGIIGGLASGGLSNLYYPAADREGGELTVQNALIGIASGAATNLLQEFVIRKLTPHAPTYAPPQQP
jgi:Carboxypeptidase regulatory-like domain